MILLPPFLPYIESKITALNLFKTGYLMPRKRNYSAETKLKLWVRAGGRCEYPGCNYYLLQDHLTTRFLNLGEIAHNVGLSDDGPRGKSLLTEEERNQVDNLLLLCTKCHKLVDTGEFLKDYTVPELGEYKLKHEQRIFELTSQADDSKSVVIRMKNKIHGDSISISDEVVRNAMWKSERKHPDYLLQRPNNVEIDLSQMPNSINSAYWKTGTQIIDETLDNQIKPKIGNSIQHLSIFAIARIPFLIYLGSKIGDKVPIDIYQKQHSESEDWIWVKGARLVKFKFRKLRKGKKQGVSLIVSISGKINISDLPKEIQNYSIYEILPDGYEPSRDLMRNKKSLISFKECYEKVLRHIEKEHAVKEVHVFPAVPISAAIYLGRGQLKAVTPDFIIYDKERQKFLKTISIKKRGKA